MNAFIQQTFNGNYSMEMWLANLIPCTMIFIAFIINMLFIPSMTQAIFGGAAGMAGSMGGVIQQRSSQRRPIAGRSGVTLCSGHLIEYLGPQATRFRSTFPLLLIFLIGPALAALVAGLIYAAVDLQRFQQKGIGLPMSSTTLATECSAFHLRQSLLTDEVGNEVYASHYAERKLSQIRHRNRNRFYC